MLRPLHQCGIYMWAAFALTTVWSACGMRILKPQAGPITGAPHGLQRGLEASHNRGLKASHNIHLPFDRPGQSNTSGDARKPQLFFLFLVYVKINNEAVWDRFFASAVRGVDYQALVHCKSEASCRANIKSMHRFEIIPSVETQYCYNLVSGTNALLAAALARTGQGTPHDKYIIVSDSTLPVQPFASMHRHFTANDGSDFCIFPRNEWAEITEQFHDGTIRMTAGVKHHQWVVLSREHAAKAVRKIGTHQDLMQRFQLNMGMKNTGCLDEFWYFTVLYGSLNLTGRPSTFHLGNFNGGPLKTMLHETQGRCDTFVHWVPRASGHNNNLTQLSKALIADPGTEMTTATEKRPASISRMSQAALLEMRKSPFFFVRKVNDDCDFSGCESLAEAFDSLVFSATPRPLAGLATNWRGEGKWLDNKNNPVAIWGAEGSISLAGIAPSMRAKGSYCRSRITVVFVNGYRAKATLTVNGQQLIWHNGVIWKKTTGKSA
mmetsp:Transcript_31455/g.60769  ORF Transcript_31455/g.60769 Transcript_31455/m.60769 type:complete len:492 (-) Transcript_31455:47-1522(-)